MMTSLQGEKYYNKIFVYPSAEDYCFSIKAIHRETKMCFCITSVNLILNELNVDSKDSRFWESDWIVTEREMKKFLKTTKQLLSDSGYLNYFEKFLDRDRNESEWENIET